MTDPRTPWNALYETGERLSWDMGRATPVLEEALARLAAFAGATDVEMPRS